MKGTDADSQPEQHNARQGSLLSLSRRPDGRLTRE